MSVQYKFVLDKRRTRDNKIYPLRLRIYDNDGNKEKSLDIFLNEKDWDDKGQIIRTTDPNYKNNSFRLTSAKNRVDRKIMLAEDGEEALLPDDIIASVSRKAAPKSKVTVRQFSNVLIADMIKAGKAGNSMAYRDAIKSIISFTGNEALKFEDITYKLLDKYNTALLTKGRKKNSKGLKVNAIAAYMRSIRAIYNKAIKAEVVSEKHYPFKKFAIETEETISRRLTIDEMKAIVNYDVPVNSPAWHNRNLFMLSFCMIGINFADMLTLTDKHITSGRIVYRRHKTGKIYNLALQPVAASILAIYMSHRRQGSNYLLPFLKPTTNGVQEKNYIMQICKNCSKYMKRIAIACGVKKEVSTYYARYSWANICKSLGYSKDLIAEALGHEYGNRVTGIYLDNYDHDTIDTANAKIIEAVFG